jgi:hypothetical protein
MINLLGWFEVCFVYNPIILAFSNKHTELHLWDNQTVLFYAIVVDYSLDIQTVLFYTIVVDYSLDSQSWIISVTIVKQYT